MEGKSDIEYQIYIGCHDAQVNKELVKESELREMVARFLARMNVGFTLVSAKGGYHYENSQFMVENSLCINIIGASEENIIALARAVSMFMNQEKALIVRNKVITDYR